MRIDEVVGTDHGPTENNSQLVALATFLKTRATEMGAKPQLSLQAFSQLARNLGVSVTFASIKDLVSKPPLSNVISNVDQDFIYFKTPENDIDALPKSNVKDPQAKVKSMAKHAIDIIKK
jgi:hypothetical protein